MSESEEEAELSVSKMTWIVFLIGLLNLQTLLLLKLRYLKYVKTTKKYWMQFLVLLIPSINFKLKMQQEESIF